MWDAFTAQRASECSLEEVATGRKKNGDPVGEIRQLSLWGNDSHTHSTWTDSLDDRDKRLWRIGAIAGLTALELANLLAGMHPLDVKKHGYTLARLLSTFRYLERKAEDMFAYMKDMQYQSRSSSSYRGGDKSDLRGGFAHCASRNRRPQEPRLHKRWSAQRGSLSP